MKRFISYSRISSKKQSEGYSLEAQTLAVQNYLKTLPYPWELINSFEEIETGSNDDRPKLKEAIELARAKSAVIVIAKLDRIGRSLKLLYLLDGSGVEFVAADYPSCDKFTAKLLMLVAEREKELIAARVRAGLEIAKLKGVKLGNRKNPQEAWQSALKSISERKKAFNRSALKHIREIESTGAKSLYRICQYMNLRGIRSSRGKKWTITAIKRVKEGQ